MYGNGSPRRGWALGLAAGLLFAAAAAQANTSAPPSAEDFARLPAMDSVRFSPDGKRFAARVERKGQLILAVVEYPSNKVQLFNSDQGSDLESFRWLTDELISIRTTKEGVSAFDLSRFDFRNALVSLNDKLRIHPDVAARAVGRVSPTSEELVVRRATGSDHGSVELEIVDTRSGMVQRKLTDEPPGPRIYRWILDKNLVPRACIGNDITTGKTESWWRESPQGPWKLINRQNRFLERGFFPVAVDADGRLLVLSNLATGRYALHRYDDATGAPGELLAGHPQYDIESSDILYGPDDRVPLGVSILEDKRRTYWFDKERAAVQQAIDASLPAGRENALRFLRNGKVLVTSTGDTEPGAYYLYDPDKRTLVELLRSRPWLQPQQLSPMQVFRYTARDGLPIVSYLTVPRSTPPDGKPPLLVWVHGGPESRDTWGFDPLVQYLASRGYAVFQPNFRGSTGFGLDFQIAGRRQWGLRMQDDITDGVRALIQQGLVDPQRICIGGASYGGYAAMMGPVREPDLFRCAVNMVGVTDLVRMYESGQADYNRRRGDARDALVEEGLKARIGDPAVPEQRRIMEANSPVRLAAQIKVPVQLLYGTDDWRVPLEHGTAMRDALKAAGVPHEWKTYTGEGHGIWDRRNMVDLMQRIEGFLSRHIGAAAKP